MSIPLVGLDDVLLVLADATGHGIGSALAVTLLRSLLRMGIHTVDSLAQLVRMANAQLMEDLSLSPHLFVVDVNPIYRFNQ